MTRPVYAIRTLRLLRLWARGWMTVAEIRAIVGNDRRALEVIAAALADEGALRARHRPHELRPDGTLPRGPEPREFRLASDWMGL